MNRYKCKHSNRVQTKNEWLKEFEDYIDCPTDYYPTRQVIEQFALELFNKSLNDKSLVLMLY